MAAKDKLNDVMKTLEEGIQGVYDSEQYKAYMFTMSKFTSYSFNNIILIHAQRPDASLVAGYKTWQSIDRHVQKGEKAIKIIAPIIKKRGQEHELPDDLSQIISIDSNDSIDEKNEKKYLAGFTVANVFDISQTDGKDLPMLFTNDLTGSVEGFEAFLAAIEDLSPAPISFGDTGDPSVYGYFNVESNRIVVRDDLGQMHTMKTLIHEVAHATLHNKDVLGAKEKDRQTKELEAESVAFVVCSHFGLDTSDYSFPYIATWNGNRDMKRFRDAMETIRNTSASIINGIDNRYKDLTETKTHKRSKHR